MALPGIVGRQIIVDIPGMAGHRTIEVVQIIINYPLLLVATVAEAALLRLFGAMEA